MRVIRGRFTCQLINVKPTNAKSFIDQISAWEKAARDEVEAVAVGYIGTAFRFLLDHSAQASGDFAANWNYSLNAENYSFTKNAVRNPDEVVDVVDLFKGVSAEDPLAINYAINNARAEQARFKLGDKVFFTNTATHDEQYAWKIEKNTIRFRQGNEGAPVEKTKVHMTSMYGYINGTDGDILKGNKL